MENVHKQRDESRFRQFQIRIQSHVFVLIKAHAFLLQQMLALLAVSFLQESLDLRKIANPGSSKLTVSVRNPHALLSQTFFGFPASQQFIFQTQEKLVRTGVALTSTPTDELTVHVSQEGREPGQGVAYLEDGTMVVVEGGLRHLDSDVTVTVMRVLQTVGGRMIFAQPKGEPLDTRRPRAASH